MLANISELTEKEKKIAITAQIKYRKAVLGTKVTDKKLLQLSSNHREFSTQELEDNLKLILRGLTHENISTRASSVYRQVDERKELINDYVAKKRKATDQIQSNQQEKIQQQDKPKLVGKNIYHKWVKEEGEEWIKGIVLKAIGNLNDDDCEFEVKYEDESEPLLVKLYEDFKNGDLAII